MGLTRRDFVRTGSLGLLAGASFPLWLRPGRAFAASATKGDPLLVIFFLRGAADALHLVPPTGDPSYTAIRERLTIEEPREFVKGFGLHPELEGAMGLVSRGQLAVVCNAGSPDPTRSHFEAQDYMEAGEVGSLRARDGWLARALGPMPESNPFEAVALAGQLPLSLRGSGAFALGGSFGLPGASDEGRAYLAKQYANAGGELGDAAVRALDALRSFERRVGRRGARRVARSRQGPSGGLLAHSVDQLLNLEDAGLPIDAAVLESTGWDTHNAQGRDQGQMAFWIRDLGDALAKLDEGLDGHRDWTAVVMTEFGRTVRPNGSGGTDHGHGSAMFVAGPRVRGGMYGEWRGLEPGVLFEGRDLPVLVDYRSVLSEVLRSHLGKAPPVGTFPSFAPETLGLFT